MLFTICLPDGYPNATVHIVLCHGCYSNFGVVYSVYLVSSNEKINDNLQKIEQNREFQDEKKTHHVKSIIDSIVDARMSETRQSIYLLNDKILNTLQIYWGGSCLVWVVNNTVQWNHCAKQHVWLPYSISICLPLALFLFYWLKLSALKPFPISKLNYFVNFR